VDVELPNGGVHAVNVKRLTEEEMVRLRELVATYKAAEDELGGFLFDLNVELQNLFLSKLFGNTAKRREPLRKDVVVVTTDPADVARLTRYFENDTEWGRHKKALESEFHKETNDP
jgi:hypothetical protein